LIVTTEQGARGAAFRKGFRARIEGPVAAVFMRTGLTPNALTLIGFGIAIAGAWLASQHHWLVAGLVVGFGAAFDLFDGALARATGKTSKLGAFMDSVFDRMGEVVVYIGIAIGLATHIDAQGAFALAGFSFPGVTGPLIAMCALGAAVMVSYARAKSESLGFSSGSGMANVGFAPREVRSVLLVLGLFLGGLFQSSQIGDCPADVACGPQTWWLIIVGTLVLILILATLTTFQRILFVYRQAQSQPSPSNQEVNK
jgi:CDP-diacylglycerol--glycerol-3-phosphate 3-phosphatidyltransferase